MKLIPMLHRQPRNIRINMKIEHRESTETKLTPAERLNALVSLVSLDYFNQSFSDLSEDDQRQFIGFLREADQVKTDSQRQNVAKWLEHFFKKMNYPADYFQDYNLMQVAVAHDSVTNRMREWEKLAKTVVPEKMDQLIDKLRNKINELQQSSPRTKEITDQIADLIIQKAGLEDERDKKISVADKKQYKGKMN